MGKELIIKMGIGLAMFGGATYYLNKGATETYQLQDVDKPVFDACKRGFKANDVEPKATSVSIYDACACIAKHASSEYDTASLDAYASIQKGFITLGAESLDNSELSDDEIADALDPERVMKRHGMDEVTYMSMSLSAMEHLGTCASAEAHEGEELARIAALRPKSMLAPEVEYREAETATASTDVLSGLRR